MNNEDDDDDVIDYTKDLLNDEKDERKYNGMYENKVDRLHNLQPLPRDTRGWIIDIEKITVLKNDEWSYDTYIKSNKTITKKMVTNFIKKKENDNRWDVYEISKEFHGGRPMGTTHFNTNEIMGDHIWVVKLKPNLYNYLKEEGYVGNIEDLYENILKGNDSYTSVLHGGGHELNIDIKKIVENINKEKKEKKEFDEKKAIESKVTLHEYFLDFVNKLFSIKLKKKEKKEKTFNHTQIFKNQFKKNTFLDETSKGKLFYTYLNILKDGKFFEKKRIDSMNCPITWNIVLKEIIKMQKKSNKIYGNVYKLTLTWKGWILETTDDIRYKVNYDKLKFRREINDLV